VRLYWAFNRKDLAHAAGLQGQGLGFIVNQQQVNGSHPQARLHLSPSMVNRYQDVLQLAKDEGCAGGGQFLTGQQKPPFALHGASEVRAEF
tara:strand:- start:4425 stop:4697 length:273 start_codon:yes stop_codon:yes gene_type:complete